MRVLDALEGVLEATRDNIEKKQARTYEELQAEQMEADQVPPETLFLTLERPEFDSGYPTCTPEPALSTTLVVHSRNSARDGERPRFQTLICTIQGAAS